MLPVDRADRGPSIRLTGVLLLWAASCATAPEEVEPPLPLAATRAHAEAQAWLRSEGAGNRRLARQAAERAAALAPDWVAPQRLLDDLMRDRTVVVIAHRLSTLAHLDRIVVFHEGRVIEDGSHDELLARDGHYAHMWHMQAGGFLPESEAGERQARALAG